MFLALINSLLAVHHLFPSQYLFFFHIFLIFSSLFTSHKLRCAAASKSRTCSLIEFTEISQPGAGSFQTVGLSKGCSSKWSVGTYPRRGDEPQSLGTGLGGSSLPLHRNPQGGGQQSSLNDKKPQKTWFTASGWQCRRKAGNLDHHPLKWIGR